MLFIWEPMSFTYFSKKVGGNTDFGKKIWLFAPNSRENQQIGSFLHNLGVEMPSYVKISKIHPILFWGPVRSTLCPKISLFGQFGLELLHFSWFSGNCDFVTEMLIFARSWRGMPDFFQNRYFLQLFLLKYVKLTVTHIKSTI